MRILIICYWIISIQVFCQTKKFSVSDIPPELTINADVVVRLKDEAFEIIATDKARYTSHEVYSIFNVKGKAFSQKIIPYSKLQKVIEFKGIVYDAQGNQIRKLKSSEIYDQSAISGFSLYEDNRLKAAELGQGTYPYTVEFEYELEYRFLFNIPSFYLFDQEKVAVESASYTLSAPENLAPRYKLLNTDQKPTIVKGPDKSLWQWQFKNQRALMNEPLGPGIHDYVPSILAGPSKFEFEKYEGAMDSWKSFGQWINTLNSGRDILPESTRLKIVQMTNGLSREEKTRLIYNYMQGKTRYVSIQIGIGGFQPFEAKVVDETGYGDCKALSFYTVSLLEAAGVNANYVLIRAGHNADKLVKEFPSTQFNHAVVAVPNGPDTLWLECTSQTNPFGYMGTFTGDRAALMITAEGAEIVNTPSYQIEQNVQSRTAHIYLKENGDAGAKVKTTYAGLQYENNGLQFVLNDQFDGQRKWIQKTTLIPSFDLGKFSINDRKGKIPSAIVELEFLLPRFASVNGKRLFLMPNLMNRSSFIPAAVENRKTKVVCDKGFVDLDTIVYHLPEGIYPEYFPEPSFISSIFGDYENSLKMDDGKLVYIRRLRINKGDFSPDTYNQLIEFYRKVSKSDNLRIAFLNKT